MKHSKNFSSKPATLFGSHNNIFLITNMGVCITLMHSCQFFLELDSFQRNNFSRYLPPDLHSFINSTCSTSGDNLVLTDYDGHFIRAFCSEMCEMSSLSESSALIFAFNDTYNNMSTRVNKFALYKNIEIYNNKDLISAGQTAHSTSQYFFEFLNEDYNNLILDFTKTDTFGNGYYSTKNKSTFMYIKKLAYTKVFLPTYLPFLSPHLTSRKLYINLGLLNFINRDWDATLLVILKIFFNGCTTLGFVEFFRKNIGELTDNSCIDELTDSSYKIYLCKINTVFAFFILIPFLDIIVKNKREIYTAPICYLETSHQNEYSAFYFGFLSPLINKLISVKPFNNKKVYSLVDIHKIFTK